MKNTIIAAVLVICAAGAGVAVGRMCARGADGKRIAALKADLAEAEEAVDKAGKRIVALKGELAKAKKGTQRAPKVSDSDDALDKARKRIVALEAELAEAKSDVLRWKKLSARAEETASVTTNVDVVAEMKRQLPEEAFVAATNALSRMKVANAERAKGRRDYLASLDVSGLSAKEQENHRRFMELFDRREKVRSKMKGLLPDQKTLGELVEIEMQMQPLAKEERKALLGAVARELGYTGENGATVTETLEGIFDCTGSGGAGGLGGLMDGAEIQPGVSVETHVIGI